MLNFIAYVKTIFDKEIGVSRQTLEQLVADYPNIVDFRITLALAYHQSGSPQEALTILNEINRFPDLSDRRPLQVAALLIFKNKEKLDELGIDYTQSENQKFLQKEVALLKQAGIQI